MKTTLTLLLSLFSATICGSFAFHGLIRKVSRRSVTVNGLSDFHLGFVEIILSVAAFIFTLPTIQKKFSTDTSPYFLNNLENRGSEYYGTLSAILAGLNVLPTIDECLSPTTGKRRVEYQGYRCITPTWEKISDDTPRRFTSTVFDKHFSAMDTNPFECIDYTNINRIVDSLDDLNGNEDSIGAFRVYKMKLNKEYFNEINGALVKDSLQLQLKDNNEGMQVSNAGGYHSVTDYFNVKDKMDGEDADAAKDASRKIRSQMAAIATLAVNIAEADDFAHSNDEHAVQQKGVNELHKGRNSMNTIRRKSKSRRLQSSVDSEAWININRHGNWNRLHTHEGSAWSGVYYLQCPPSAPPTPAEGEAGGDANTGAVSSTTYSGRLLIKPSPHITENKYDLSKVEMDRLNCFPRKSQISKEFSLRAQLALPTLPCCDYLEIEPEDGMFIIMPGWLQHAVFPLQIQPLFLDSNKGTRISLAFNFAEE